MLDWSAMFEGGVQIAPPVTDAQLSGVPGKRGVVALLGGAAPDYQPILLMTAANMRSRVAARMANPEETPGGEEGAIVKSPGRKLPDLRAITTRIVWKQAFSHFETDLYYFELARTIWPQEYTKQLAWKPPWFVHVNPEESYPHFVRTRDVLREAGTYVGPFPGGSSAEKFIESIEDAFDLCRDCRCLRQSPHGRPCSYSQIGRCLGPCHGRISMDEYCQVVGRARDFACGDREAFAGGLRARMKTAADTLAFEAAGTLKTKLDRLREFEQEQYAHIRPVEEFRFLLVQSGEASHRLRTFFADRGAVSRGGDLEYPPTEAAMFPWVERMAAIGALPRMIGEEDRWRMGLLAHYLFCAPSRRGVMVRWHDGLTAAEVAQAIEAAASLLHWSPAKRKRGPKPGGEEAPPQA